VAGSSNVAADFLSRNPVGSMNFRSNFSTSDLIDKQLEAVKECSNYHSIKLKEIKGVWYDVSISDIFRPLIPKNIRETCIASIHNFGHYGFRPTYQLLREQACWYKMRKDVKNFVNSCVICNLKKSRGRKKIKKIQFEEGGIFDIIHVDIIGPLPPNREIKYIVTIIDRFSSWFEAIPVPDISSVTIIKAIKENWICRYGPPKKLISDQGRQFESDLFKKFCSSFGIFKIRTTPYNPNSNGKVEIFNRYLKQTIRLKGNDTNWLDILPEALLCLRLKPNSALGISPLEKLCGKKSFVKLFDSDLSSKQKSQTQEAMAYVKIINPTTFGNRFTGPYRAKVFEDNTADILSKGKHGLKNQRNLKIIPLSIRSTSEEGAIV